MKSYLSGFLCLLCLSSLAQTTSTGQLNPGYYVVVAAYSEAQVEYAQAFSTKVNEQGRHSNFGLDPTRKLQYVYLDYYTDFNESVRQMLKARTEGFDRAWVRVMKGTITGEKPNLQVSKKVTPAETKPVPIPKEEKTTSTTKTETVVKTEVPETKPSAEVKRVPQIIPVAPTETVESKPVAVEIGNNDLTFHPALLTGSTVLFTLFNPASNAEVDGEVEIVDTDRSKLISKAKGNDFTTLPDPKSKSGNLILISSSFGFRKVQHELNYKSTEKDSLPTFMDVVDNHYRIRFEMVRLHRGDIAVLYNVYFYNDAAVMVPESKYELNKLLKMMQDNPTYAITLHGHTNGNNHGKIISMGNSKDFFTLNSDVKNGFGSAKELSRARAQVIKDWLVSNNIAAERVVVQPHGGKRMIHDKNGPNAKRNVRVEVEITNE
jgi:outer membrane protein OmpA-like peptidoglycan-associated protein